jgi:hypothetical protein
MICRDKEVGSLRVLRIREFNLSLLEKWCWRLVVEQNGLWLQVLVGKYGLEDGQVKGGGRMASAWWRDCWNGCRSILDGRWKMVKILSFGKIGG